MYWQVKRAVIIINRGRQEGRQGYSSTHQSHDIDYCSIDSYPHAKYAPHL